MTPIARAPVRAALLEMEVEAHLLPVFVHQEGMTCPVCRTEQIPVTFVSPKNQRVICVAIPDRAGLSPILPGPPITATSAIVIVPFGGVEITP